MAGCFVVWAVLGDLCFRATWFCVCGRFAFVVVVGFEGGGCQRWLP